MNSSVEKNCSHCQSSSATLNCGICRRLTCKACAEFVGDDVFSFSRNVAPELLQKHYCHSCFVASVEPATKIYKENMKRAKLVYIVEKSPRYPLPVVRKSTQTLKIENCADREETILRLAFQAVELGFNAVIRTKVAHEKVRNAGYQKMMWRGTGQPVDLDRTKHERSYNPYE